MIKLKKIKSLLLTGILVGTIAVPAVAYSSNGSGYQSWNCMHIDDAVPHTVAINRNIGLTSGGTKQTYGMAATGNVTSNFKWVQVTINAQSIPNSGNSTWVQTQTLTVGGSYYTVFEDHIVY